MNQLMHFKPSHRSAQKMLNHWQLNHPNQLFIFNQLCFSLPEVTDQLKCFADFLSDSIRIHDVSLFELSLTQAISRLETLSQGKHRVEDFFESLTFVAANALYSVAIGDPDEYYWKVSDGVYFTDWLVKNPKRLHYLKHNQLKIRRCLSDKQSVRRVQQMLKDKMLLAS